MTTKEIPDYLAEYELFMNNFRQKEISGEEVGEVIMRMSGYFSQYNMRYAEALRAYAGIVKDMESSTDENTGKPLSSTKAKALADATAEAATYNMAKVHVQNIEQNINALKALQRGVLSEYAHAAIA